MINRLLDWLSARLGLCIDFTGDLMTPDWHDGDGDPHYRRPRYDRCPTCGGAVRIEGSGMTHYYVPVERIVTPQQHAARLKGRRTQ